MSRFPHPVTECLEYYNGLDFLDRSTPTVMEDPSFEATTVAVLRDHFNQWATSVPQEEKSVDDGECAQTSLYHIFVVVDQEVLESVLSSPVDDTSRGLFVWFKPNGIQTS